MSEEPSLLQQAVSALTQYFVGDETLGDTLLRVTQITMRALPQTDHVGITMMVDGKPGTAIFTHPEVPDIDQAQYRTGTGPCLDAFRTGETYVIASTLEPGRWQEFRDSAAKHGVLSTLSLPMIAEHRSLGAMNLYAETEAAYDSDAIVTGRMFAAQAAFALANAQAYWDARSLSENLEQAMVSRADIEQAKGILIATMHCTREQAIALLIEQSQHENIKLRDIAKRIVDQASTPRHQ